jgi:hypothetical protein
MNTYTYREFLFDISWYHDGASDQFIIQDLKQLLVRCRQTKQLGAAQSEITVILQALISRLDKGKELTFEDVNHIRDKLADILFIAYCVKRPKKFSLCGDGHNVLAEKLGLKVKTIQD